MSLYCWCNWYLSCSKLSLWIDCSYVLMLFKSLLCDNCVCLILYVGFKDRIVLWWILGSVCSEVSLILFFQVSRCLSMYFKVGICSVGTSMFCKWYLYLSQSALWNCFCGVIGICIRYAEILNTVWMCSEGMIDPGEMCVLRIMLWLARILCGFPDPLCVNMVGKDDPGVEICCDVIYLPMLSRVSHIVLICPLMSLIKYLDPLLLNSTHT